MGVCAPVRLDSRKVNNAFRCKAKQPVQLARNKETISCIKDCSNFDIFFCHTDYQEARKALYGGEGGHG